jgi:hypothetical protein
MFYPPKLARCSILSRYFSRCRYGGKFHSFAPSFAPSPSVVLWNSNTLILSRLSCFFLFSLNRRCLLCRLSEKFCFSGFNLTK